MISILYFLLLVHLKISKTERLKKNYQQLSIALKINLNVLPQTAKQDSPWSRPSPPVWLSPFCSSLSLRSHDGLPSSLQNIHTCPAEVFYNCCSFYLKCAFSSIPMSKNHASLTFIQVPAQVTYSKKLAILPKMALILLFS